MRKRSLLFVLLGMLILTGVASGTLYAYDSTRADLIAKNASVGGVDVGGMRIAAARKRLRERLLVPLRRAVIVRHGDRRFRLTAESAQLSVDTEQMLQTALKRSRSGGFLSRSWDSLIGQRSAISVPLEISYSNSAVRRMALRVEKSLSRPARNATLTFSSTGFSSVSSRTGLTVDRARLQRQLVRRLTSPQAKRLIKVRSRRVEPKVRTEDLAREYPTLIVVSRSGFRLRFFKNLKLAKTYKIAVGQVGLDTPAGLYRIQDKQVNPSWHVPHSDWAGKLAGKVIPPGPRNPIKARWMGIYAGAGIHGTSDTASLGSAASHGCVRMAVPDVIDLYDRVPVQTPIYIA